MMKMLNRDSPDVPDPDELLATRLQGGDQAAFAALTARYWNAVHRITRSMLPTESEADEAAEETFLVILRSGASFSSAEPFRDLLYRIAIDQSLLRLQATPQAVAGSLDDVLGKAFATAGWYGGDWSGFEEKLVKRRDLGERIQEALERVEHLDRAAFTLNVSELLSAEEAAAILRMAPGEIRVRTHRTLLVLTAALRQLADAQGT
jgi:DNA-directed RNA polymerase specialized sigma24 family protein